MNIKQFPERVRHFMRDQANKVVQVILVGATCMMIFGWWGLHTKSGRRQLDEMAGMIPVVVGSTGFQFAMCSSLPWLVLGPSKRDRSVLK